jgi:hypothetical protein
MGFHRSALARSDLDSEVRKCKSRTRTEALAGQFATARTAMLCVMRIQRTAERTCYREQRPAAAIAELVVLRVREPTLGTKHDFRFLGHVFHNRHGQVGSCIRL